MPSPEFRTITSLQARRFMQHATGLHGGFGDVQAALDHLGSVQIDPINVCGRMQDHILRHRVRGYAEEGLMRHLHRDGPRSAFEHHLPDSGNLAAIPLEAWLHLQAAMRQREREAGTWSGKLDAAEKRLAACILERMTDEGPLCSQDMESARVAKHHPWGSSTLAKRTLQKLFFHGRVLIARREGNRRYYDLPARVLPEAVLGAPVPKERETRRWLAGMKLRQRRMARLKTTELSVIADEVQAVRIVDAGVPMLHVLRSDLPLFDSPASGLVPLLLAPLDPVIYDRSVTEAVWRFDYRWEVYTPPEKRVRGYYALPLLHRDAFIGHADLKTDRGQGRLRIVSQKPASSPAARAAVKSLAGFLGLS